MQNPANPQTLNRYSYVLNNSLKYVDPSGNIVDIEGEGEALNLLAAEDEGFWIDEDTEAWDTIQNWAQSVLDWEELQEKEKVEEYTQHMIDSPILFSIVNIDLTTNTITFVTDMFGLDFDGQVKLTFTKEGFEFHGLKALGRHAVSVFPVGIYMRTDVRISTEKFTNLVAHELYHTWEQSQDPVG